MRPFISRSTVLTTSKNSLSVGFCPSSFGAQNAAETNGKTCGEKTNSQLLLAAILEIDINRFSGWVLL